MFLLDANILVDAHRDYYPLARVPEFWEWLLEQGKQGKVKIPREILAEIVNGNPDELTAWIKNSETEEALILDDEVNIEEVSLVVYQGYAADLNDIEIESIGRDPILIAYALKDTNRTIITSEISKPSKKRQNRRIPDVCDTLNIPWGNTFKMTTDLNFSTHWNENRNH